MCNRNLVVALQGGVQMSLLEQVKNKTGKTGFQLYYLAYSALDREEDPVDDEYIQRRFEFDTKYWEPSEFVKNFLLDVLQGRREV